MPQKKILIVEDEGHIVTVLDIRLSSENYEIFSESEGTYVIERALSVMPDLIMLDLILPGKNGHQLLVEIRNHPELQHIPVVICSAKVSRNEIDRSMALGANHYLVKPFEVSELIDIIKTLIDQKGKPHEVVEQEM